MTRRASYEFVFVEAFPDSPDDGILHVSLRFSTTMHLCMCGCGEEVIAPLDPADWTAIFDGQTVSLSPSIGNWALKCESHYVLARGLVKWAPHWSRARIEAGRERDRIAKARRYDDGKPPAPTSPPPSPPGGRLRRRWRSIWGT